MSVIHLTYLACLIPCICPLCATLVTSLFSRLGACVFAVVICLDCCTLVITCLDLALRSCFLLIFGYILYSQWLWIFTKKVLDYILLLSYN